MTDPSSRTTVPGSLPASPSGSPSGSATGSATEAATGSATEPPTGSATEPPTGSATEAPTEAATDRTSGSTADAVTGPGGDTGGDRLLDDAATIDDPDADAEETARARLGGEDAAAYGRLGELALWWAAVRGDRPWTRARRVLLAGGGQDVAARRPGVRALALPRGGDVAAAIGWGVATADGAADDGTDLVVLCLDDPAAWRALGAELMALEPVEASGWPHERGMSDARWMDEVVALRDRLTRLRGWGAEPVRLLTSLDSAAAAAAAALLVRATARRTPVLLDGPGAATAGLLALRANYAAPRWWQVAHQTTDPLHERILGSLGLEPVCRLGVVPEDGTASLAALALLDAAVALLGPAAAPDDDLGLDLDV